MKSYSVRGWAHLICVVALTAALAACTFARNDVPLEEPNYDNLVGKKFSESVFRGRQVFKIIRVDEVMEELEKRRSDGCILVFGVRKKDDVIAFWRVDSGAGTCKVAKSPRNWNR